MAHHIIYIPGLGDHRSYGQDIAIQLFRLFGFVPHYMPLGWLHKESFEAKLQRLTSKIDGLQAQHQTISLIGVSAGASAVLNAYAQRNQLAKVVCICGKIQRPETVKPAVYAKNPDFKESMAGVETSLRQLRKHDLIKNIMSIHPLRDKSVPPEDTKIVGAVEKTIPAWSHASGIVVGVIVGSPIIATFLRSKS